MENMGDQNEFLNLILSIRNREKPSLFQKIRNEELSSDKNELFKLINTKTKEIDSFLDDSIKSFHKLFNNDLKDFEDCIQYLEKKAIPNNCICAGVIDNIPGWRCVECSKYENAIYCNDCYIKSKDAHKNHKVLYLFSSSGMCDCGDPDSLTTFCPDHSGPLSDQKQIDEYISKSFEKEILDKLKSFFDVFFLRFSEYLILTEKCEYFYKDSEDELDESSVNEKKDIMYLKDNFGVVFQNMIHFLRLISQKNLGMLNILANYFLKSHLENQKLGNEYYTTHRCLKITENDIKLFYEDKQSHICVCPFFRLFMSNYRDNIKTNGNENEQFLLSFAHNMPLRTSYCVIFFAIYKEAMLNNNDDILFNRHQFYLEDITHLIAEKTHLIEESFDILYDYFFKSFNSPKIKNEYGSFNEFELHNLGYKAFLMRTDTKYFSKPQVKILMTEKTSIMKKVIDMICLIHNENEFKSIVPHPQFQNKGISSKLIELEIKLLDVVQEINIFIDWEKIEFIKDFITYLINKILYQEKEGIKQLKEDEFSFHLGLYRAFGIIMNAFCFNHSFNKNCSLMDSVEFFKEKLFDPKEKVEEFVNIILKDYFKLFGFIAGAKNNYFNYYESLSGYSNFYFLSKTIYIMDFSLLKYLFVLKDKSIKLDLFLQSSNVEDVYSSFKDSFILENKMKNIEEDKTAKVPAENDKTKKNDINNNIETTNEINENPSIEFNENLLQLLRNNYNRQINVNLINQLIFSRNIERRSPEEEKATDENNCIMQWRLLLEILIVFMKDDSCPYSNLMKNYGDTISSKTKADLFNKVRNNELAMEDLGNILKEKLIHEIIAEGNLIDLKKISKNFDNYLEILFEEDNKFNEVLDELTYNKMNGDIKMFYLKDSYLKYLDINYYFSFKNKSNAQRYILDFKKDIIKSYNNYYYKPSKLTFDFYEMIYEKIFLSKDNLELMIKIIKKLLSEEKITKYLDIKSVRSSLLPIILNYFSMFGVINTKAFIEFKMENQKLIDNLCKILSNCLENNKDNHIIEKDLEDNVNEVLSQLNRYQIIINSFNGDLSKLEKYNYYTDLENITQNNKKDSNINSINLINDNNLTKADDDKKKKSKNMKSKFKNLMLKKANLFMEKVSSDTEIIKEINEHNKNEEKNSNDEIMCFFCRNPIKLNSFEVPYGKIGLQIDDSFYSNSVRATIRTELDKLTNKENKTIIYNKMLDNFYNDLYNRIISCGHYFHLSCFIEGCSKHEDQFVCPLCLRNQNILIPPLNNFNQKYSFLKSENFEAVFKGKVDENKNENENDKDAKLFDDIVEEFLNRLEAKKEYENYSSFLENIYPYYKSYFNFLENIFYMDGTTFHKYQQIDTFQNFILLLRFLINTNNIDKTQIVDYIKTTLCNLVKGPGDEKYIYNNGNYMDLFQKILLSLSILFDYEEMKNIFKYIISIFLPYFNFGFYYRHIMFKKENDSMKTFDFNEKMNIKELEKYVIDENQKLLDYFNDFLKKFLIVKLVTDFTNKNECIINTFKELSTKNLISFLEMDDLFKFLPSEEIKLNDIINNLAKIFNENEVFYRILGGSFNYDNVVNSLFSNVIKFSKEQSITNLELIIQFAPIKFGFTYLDNNIFDWIQRNVGKECDICHKPSKYSFICLICGNKVCHQRTRIFDITLHTKKCGGKYCLFVDMDNMKVYIWSNNQQFQKLSSIYVNKAGIGPRGLQFDNEFNLSHEKVSTIMKNYACVDFHLN